MQTLSNEDISALNSRFEQASANDILAWALETFGSQLAVACSLGVEDTAIVHMLASLYEQSTQRARVFVLDTARLHQETYEVYDRLVARYEIPIEVFFPQHVAVENLVRAKGTNSFYNSIDDRKECCAIRKLEPLSRALASSTAWVTGLRRSQSPTRSDLHPIERDGNRIKVNPLIAWNDDQIWTFARSNSVPFNKLHNRGFPSIGCAPCTRAIEPGEDIRAGRWWWEDPSLKECGLHKKS